ncbi:hypothetical protein BLOT_005102 [Blomia tropicalis]|nr:hypothetical protein BLOT_005102 [Blomia tropicalis]
MILISKEIKKQSRADPYQRYIRSTIVAHIIPHILVAAEATTIPKWANNEHGHLIIMQLELLRFSSSPLYKMKFFVKLNKNLNFV